MADGCKYFDKYEYSALPYISIFIVEAHADWLNHRL